MFLDGLIYVLMTIHYFMLLCVSIKMERAFCNGYAVSKNEMTITNLVYDDFIC